MQTKLIYVAGSETSFFNESSGRQVNSKKGTFVELGSGNPYVNVSLAEDVDFSRLRPMEVYEASLEMKMKIVNGICALVPSKVSVNCSKPLGVMEFRANK